MCIVTQATFVNRVRRAASNAMALILLSAVGCLLTPSPTSAQLKYADLRTAAREAIRNHEVTIDEPEFRVEEGTFYFVLGGGQTVLDVAQEHRDPMNVAIEAQLRVEVIRMTRGANRKRQYWEPILAKVEAAIEKRLAGLQDKRRTEREREDEAAALWKEVDQIYNQAMEEYARKEGLKIGKVARFAPPHNVKLITSPPGGRIFLAHAIQVRIAQSQGKDPDWRLVEDPASVELQGKYFYLLQWGGKTVKADRPIQIDRNGTFVLR